MKAVFRLMLGADCKRQPVAWKFDEQSHEESATAVARFGGALSGACFLHCSAATAMKFVARVMGIEFYKLDDPVHDGGRALAQDLSGKEFIEVS